MGKQPSWRWLLPSWDAVPGTLPTPAGKCGHAHAGGRSGCRQDGKDAWRGPLHARRRELTRFLPLAATRRAKATFLPAASAPCPGGGFAHGDAALGGHEAPSRHGPIPAEPALPIVPKTSDSSVLRPAAGAALLRCNPRHVAGAAAASPAHRRFCSLPRWQESAASPPALTGLQSPALLRLRFSRILAQGPWCRGLVRLWLGPVLPQGENKCSCVPDGDGYEPRLAGCSPARRMHPCLRARTSFQAQSDARTHSQCRLRESGLKPRMELLVTAFCT